MSILEATLDPLRSIIHVIELRWVIGRVRCLDTPKKVAKGVKVHLFIEQMITQGVFRGIQLILRLTPLSVKPKSARDERSLPRRKLPVNRWQLRIQS